MANKLNNGGMDKALNASQILATHGRILTSGFMDEFDREAESADRAIRRAKQLAPRRIGAPKSGFYRPHYAPNADRHNFAMVG